MKKLIMSIFTLTSITAIAGEPVKSVEACSKKVDAAAIHLAKAESNVVSGKVIKNVIREGSTQTTFTLTVQGQLQNGESKNFEYLVKTIDLNEGSFFQPTVDYCNIDSVNRIR